jgi:hypothetical protein
MTHAVDPRLAYAHGAACRSQRSVRATAWVVGPGTISGDLLDVSIRYRLDHFVGEWRHGSTRPFDATHCGLRAYQSVSPAGTLARDLLSDGMWRHGATIAATIAANILGRSSSMFARTRALAGALVIAAALSACSNDVTSPSSAASVAHFARAATDTTVAGSTGGGGGGGGGGSSSGSCGVLSSSISTYNIVVYTTRIGIGFSGTATNCGSHNEAFEVVATDVNPDLACRVNVPHFIAAKNTAPGAVTTWGANSTLVPCMNTTHTFTLTLIDTKTGQALDSTTVSAFL